MAINPKKGFLNKLENPLFRPFGEDLVTDHTILKPKTKHVRVLAVASKIL